MQPDKCFTNTCLFGQDTTWGAWNMQMKLSFCVWLFLGVFFGFLMMTAELSASSI